jgi:translation initiation factor 2B subunit (eIF-2B alpha/beta/delta family)
MPREDFMWLDENVGLGEKLKNIRKYAQKTFERKDKTQLEPAIDHGTKHCESVENAIHHLIPKELYLELSTEERFFLLTAPWIYNIAWFLDKDKNERLTTTKVQGQIIEWLKQVGNQDQLSLDSQEARIFQQMFKHFSVKSNLEECPDMTFKSGIIRTSLLTAYFRLADAIHVDECGGPSNLFYFLDNPDLGEFFHWLKGKLMLNLDILPKPGNNSIDLDINDHAHVENLIEQINDDLKLYINSVRNTLVIAGITKYINLSKKKYSGPALLSDEKARLENLENEFQMAYSPNAGMLQYLYLSSLEQAARQDSESKRQYSEINNLQELAKTVGSRRLCHVALNRYIAELDEILQKKENEKIPKILNWVRKKQMEREERLSKVYEEGTKALKDFNYFLVFGYSNTIIKALEMLFANLRKKNQIHIYVCEATNKSRFDPMGNLIYIDGKKYAEKLKEVIPNANVTIIPDITIASVFKSKSGGRWAVLFGANGITEAAYCGHSAGHLSIAIIANHFKKPVYILCDSYKIGRLDKHDDVTYERQDQWLKGFLHMEYPAKINLLNLRESVIEPLLISKIVTEDGPFSIEEFIQRYST